MTTIEFFSLWEIDKRDKLFFKLIIFKLNGCESKKLDELLSDLEKKWSKALP